MADINPNGNEKAVDGAATVPESQPSVPPVVKVPANEGEKSIEPSITTDTAKASAADEPKSEPAAQNDATTDSKEEPTKKIDEADKLASQPEKPADSAPTEPATTDAATTDAPVVANGDSKDPPKPVSVEEVHDQDMPDAAPSKPTEASGALPVQEPKDDAPKADAAPITTDSAKTEPSTGDKRKGEPEAKVSNGNTTVEEHSEAPAEKKQKTNGAATNGAPKKAGRPKKDKSEKKAPAAAAPPVGRTARKTRSQGAAD
ncbi:uncharacterized protein F4822DRAFT_325906 [Hypoxylon trugodes]|uniref:uncharacterized protein n=1 Tax=Hypoxylon trugodes TaxID=326681 RepID=UPI0021960EEB|nr:uncharacterized protein F4822DRAFT_325906 [Hypoxylon trugodes]KAI1386770.1 hypothetical protein F4822DRAFT_325906 [Hypoxylon trugodes]